MKVGVYIGHTAPDAGGGYTFVHDVLDAIVAASPRAAHEFVILTTVPAAAAGSAGALPVVSLEDMHAKAAFQARIRAGRLLNRVLGRPWVPWTRPRPELDRMIADAGVDVIWYLTPGAWLEVFRKDMHGVLLAELDVRFLPLEGLLAALRSHALGTHVQTSA